MPSHKNFRFPPLTESNATLALRPLLIPGMHEPVQDGDGGINIQIATGDPDGLQCVINPYGDPMSEGDKLEIHANNERVLERFVQADEINQRVFFHLPTPLESGWIENCHYVLTRVDATVPDPPSAALRIWVKLYKPGDRDKEPHLPDGHSELNIVQLPPELVEQGEIDAEWAKRGVPATIPQYVFSTRNDQVRLQLGDYWLPAHRITKAQADGQQPIVILIDQDAILGAGDGLRREIKYFINDEVWNWADRHSKRTSIDVDAGGWRLEAPIIKEAVNGVITIRDLNKLPVTIQIHVRSEYFAVGDSVKMTFTGTPPNNGEPIICSETRDIENVPSVLEIPVPYELIRVIAQGRADAFYILYKKDGGAPLSSKRAIARVEGDVNILPEPSIRELMGDTLDPDELYATVDVRYDMKNGDLICLIWSGIKSNGDDYRHEVPHIVTGNEAKEGLVTFYIDSEHISVLDNGTLDLFYVVANDAPGLLDIRESERLLAKVEKVRATLPKPVVEEAEPPGDVLDPSKVFDSVHVLIAEANTLKDDVMTYYWRSPTPLFSTSDWLPITAVSAGQPVRFRIDKEYVTSNIGQYIDVCYVLRRAASLHYEYSATLELLIGVLVVPIISSVTDSKGEGIPDNGVTFDTTVTVTGIASPNLSVRLYDGNTALTPDVPVDANGNWSRVIRGLSPAAHPIKAKALYGAQPESAVRSFTVAQTVTPTITDITDSKGTVAPNGTTFDTSVTVTGKASPSQTVRLYDGNTALTPDVPVDASGNWSRVISGLSPAAHPIKAKALYGAQPESAVRSFTVAQTVTPTITDITDSKGTVAPNGTTFDTSVTVTGKASPGQTVRLYDGNTALTPDVPVDASGNWSRVISGLSPAAHPIKAKALYGAQPESAVRSFTAERWTDSVTDFANGTSGNWTKGEAGYQGLVTGGVFQNFTPGASGHSGLLFSQSFRFVAGHTYTFSYRVRNQSPQPDNLRPIFSVRLSTGQAILPVYYVPRTGQWYTQTANFSVTQSMNYTIQMMSHQDRGGGSGSDGGNDYQIDDIVVRLVR